MKDLTDMTTEELLELRCTASNILEKRRKRITHEKKLGMVIKEILDDGFYINIDYNQDDTYFGLCIDNLENIIVDVH